MPQLPHKFVNETLKKFDTRLCWTHHVVVQIINRSSTSVNTLIIPQPVVTHIVTRIVVLLEIQTKLNYDVFC